MSNIENLFGHSSENMFSGCSSLVGGAGTTYDENHTDVEYAHIDEGPSNPGYLTYKAPVGIKTVQMTLGNNDIYTLSGKKLNKPQKGLNIIRTNNGKAEKHFVK